MVIVRLFSLIDKEDALTYFAKKNEHLRFAVSGVILILFSQDIFKVKLKVQNLEITLIVHIF